MRITPAEGMNDYLPQETELRDRLIENIVFTYKANGFTKITTPIVESIDNLDNSDGGDNLRLIFRLMKRGKKLEDAYSSGDIKKLCDLGLRYDLTLPLARYYTNNRDKLPSPFKCIQIDRVYRAERPQKGRSREFVQCDIDIIGSESADCETELIAVTAEALLKIGINDFTVRLNDRALLRSIISYAGFPEEDVGTVCVSIDKADKIGYGSVKEELLAKDYLESTVNTLIGILEGGNTSLSDFEKYGAGDAASNLSRIIEASEQIAAGRYSIKFDITLVRGQGYYTGTIFEIDCPAFGGTIAGGGRYDRLIERFTGSAVPAVGFSIGFERIYSILLGSERPAQCRKKVALLYDEGNIVSALTYSGTIRDKYDVTLVSAKKKLGKQLAQLERQGFDYAVFLNDTSAWKPLGTAE